jgi:hypothetical protein
LSWLVLVLFVPVNKFTILEGTPVRECPTSTRSTGAVLLVPVSWLVLVLFVPVSKSTLLEGTPVREYPTSTRSTGAVVLVPVLFALGWLTGSLAGFMARPERSVARRQPAAKPKRP